MPPLPEFFVITLPEEVVVHGSLNIKYCIVTLRGVWNLARKLGYQVIPIEFPDAGVGKARTRFLNAEEERRLLRAIAGHV